MMFGFLFGIITACSTDSKPNSSEQASETSEQKIQITRDVIGAQPAPTIFLAQTWFLPDSNEPGPARIEMWRKESNDWTRARLEDPDSNTFHKVVLLKDERSFLTIGATKANLTKWHFSGKEWSSQLLYSKSWKEKGGKFDRFRDIEVGDVDGDQKDEYVIATHDYGEIIVLHPDESYRADSFGEKSDTFVHEIELGDIDSDGTLEIYATPSERNSSTRSQSGNIVQYKWTGSKFSMSIVDEIAETHAKEILVADIDGDGRDELFGVIEAQKVEGKRVSSVEIRQYSLNSENLFSAKKIAEIEDDQTRFLLNGDYDHDGKTDLVAASYHQGIFLFKQSADGGWESTTIDRDSGGFEHACYGADLDSDGRMELYVASDKHGRLSRYTYDATEKSFTREIIGNYASNKIFTWNLMVGIF